MIFLSNDKTTTINTNTRWESSLSHSIKLCENDKCKSKFSLEYRKYSNNYNNEQLQKKITELNKLIETKFKVSKTELDIFLRNFSFNLVESPLMPENKLFEIRDENDYIILYTAIIENVDIFITGDKDFNDVKINKPIIMTVSEFLNKFS